MSANPPRDKLTRLAVEVARCMRCPRLRRHCEAVGKKKRRAYREEIYWKKPVPGFGDPRARLLIVGLAPGAHGANRTGRMFTGDGSGDFLFAALHRAGFASQPASISRDDGLRLRDAYITAVVRCAPPDNRPLPSEIARCRRFLVQEMDLLQRARAVLVLGRIALDGYLAAASRDVPVRRSMFPFVHGAWYNLDLTRQRLFVSYHPSRQNTQTGRLTSSMMDGVLGEIRNFLNGSE